MNGSEECDRVSGGKAREGIKSDRSGVSALNQRCPFLGGSNEAAIKCQIAIKRILCNVFSFR